MARMLAGARDAQAALDAVADTEPHAPSHRLSSQSWETIRHKLEDIRVVARRARASHRPSAPASPRRSTAPRRRVERWPLDDVTFADIAEGLSRTLSARAPQDPGRLAGGERPGASRPAPARRGASLSDGTGRAAMAEARAKLGARGAEAAQPPRQGSGPRVLSRYAEPHQPLAPLALAPAIGGQPAAGAARRGRRGASPAGCLPKSRRRSASASRRCGKAWRRAASPTVQVAHAPGR